MPIETQAQFASLLTVLYDSKVICRPQLTRAFEKLIQSAEALRCQDISDVEDKIFSYLSVAVEDGLLDMDTLTRLPEAFVNNLSESILENEPNIAIYKQHLRSYKAKCVHFMEDFFNCGEASLVSDFFREMTEAFEWNPEKAEVDENPASGAIFPRMTKDTFRHEFVRRLIATSLDQSNEHREMVSKCLSELYASGEFTLSPDDIQFGILRLIGGIQDLILDVPMVSDMLSKYAARMIVDDILPPAFVSDFMRLNMGNSLGVATLRRTFRWMTDLAGHHILCERFKKVWIGTEQYRPEVEHFKRELRDIIFDYFDTADVQTGLTLLNNMDMSPDQMVEAIRKIIVFALERHRDVWTRKVFSPVIN